MNLTSIAKKAGVSTATVSLALNDREGVSRRTREKILRIAKEIGYKKRPARITTKCTVQLLKIIRHGRTLNKDHNIFISEYIDGITHKAKAVQFRVELGSATVNSGLSEFCQQMNRQEVSGYLVLGTELSPEDIHAFSVVREPVVFFDTCQDFLPFDFVDMNNLDSVFLAVSRLASAGHRSIGMVTSPVNVVNFRIREDGFRRAMAYLGLEVDERFVYWVDSTYQGAYENFSAVLAAGGPLPEALFCCNDIVCLGVIRALREAGRSIPEDISLIGFDNLPASAQSDPPLSTISVSNQEIGATALLLLKERIENPDKPYSKVLISGELVERQSVRNKEERL